MGQTSERPSAISCFFIGFIVIGVLVAAFSGKMQAVGDASFEAAKGAVTLALGLIGIMALWLGLMRVLEAGGFMFTIAKLVKPVMVRLFPDVPPEHPAMSAMILNIAANMLGLGNAATPFGLRAMTELNRLNPLPGVATNAMCMFLAINTSNVSLLPLGTIGVRAAAGSKYPAAIFIPTLLATTASTVVGIAAARLLAGRDRGYRARVAAAAQGDAASDAPSGKSDCELPTYEHLRMKVAMPARFIGFLVVALFLAAAVVSLLRAPSPATFLFKEFVSFWLMPGLMLAIVTYGVSKGVRVYEAVTEGAKQGFDIAVRIIPFLVAILVAVAIFRASGAMEVLVSFLSPVTELIGIPAETVPLAIVRPLSGSGAFAVMSAIVNQAPDSYSAFVASTMMGSTETTFYVLAVYFGAAGVVKMRHALAAGLLADIAGVVATGVVCRVFWA